MNRFLSKICNSNIGLIYFTLANIATNYLFPIFLVFVRAWMAKIFYYSGLTKIGNMKTTIYLFKYEYKVPILSPEFAAYLTTGAEIVMPILLVFGLFARISAIGLLIITGIIQFTYMQIIDHVYWAILLGIIILNGPGKLSFDHLVQKFFVKKAIKFERNI